MEKNICQTAADASMKISVVINTYNASKHLRKVIESVLSFDEILVCDMESTDNTLDIAREYGCRILTFPKGEHTIAEPARDYAIKQASHPWLLVVDADEIVPDALREYLYGMIRKPDCPSGIYIPRKNYFLGKFMHSSYPDPILRFFKKEGSSWPPVIHSFPVVEGPLYHIPARRKDLAFIHLANESVTEYFHKANLYTDNEIIKKGNRKYGMAAFFFRPFFRFFKAYILKGGFRSGKEGFIKACMDGIYQFIFLSKLYERRHDTQIKDKRKKREE